jgi:hypothetical protein
MVRSIYKEHVVFVSRWVKLRPRIVAGVRKKANLAASRLVTEGL